ncbi:MAG: hypothetical protein ACT6RU_14405 [Aliihoeflea sp.]|uniref:hypothetical protein n=1 Tax=Aliihoeflea sp. TaxID=2608088 RepID=UPI0040347DFD
MSLISNDQAAQVLRWAVVLSDFDEALAAAIANHLGDQVPSVDYDIIDVERGAGGIAAEFRFRKRDQAEAFGTAFGGQARTAEVNRGLAPLQA